MTPPGPRPTALPVRAAVIPAPLAALDRWVVWRWTWDARGRRWTKPPSCAHTGRVASTADPTTWVSFEGALAAYAAGGWDGVGFVLVPADGLTGLDLDRCREPATGAFEPWAAALVTHFGSYAEISPSGTGVRILVRGSLLDLLADDRLGLRRDSVELYSGGRYLTVTGQSLAAPPLPLTERQAELAAYVAALLPEAAAATGNRPEVVSEPPQRGDDGVLAAARAARNGVKFAALFDRGDLSAYDGDDSRADQALVSLLAFWTRDPAQLDRLFRRSTLYRPKWERADYRDRTIARALAGSVSYEPPAQPGRRVWGIPTLRGRRPVLDLSTGGNEHGR